mmetsp:Transcript_123177/g.353903  ORF Transcript_123177/g.353903 Transcript_123177/m.353903 type:complete len:326 (+) Transcript_123177:651-1628(+)
MLHFNVGQVLGPDARPRLPPPRFRRPRLRSQRGSQRADAALARRRCGVGLAALTVLRHVGARPNDCFRPVHGWRDVPARLDGVPGHVRRVACAAQLHHRVLAAAVGGHLARKRRWDSVVLVVRPRSHAGGERLPRVFRAHGQNPGALHLRRPAARPRTASLFQLLAHGGAAALPRRARLGPRLLPRGRSQPRRLCLREAARCRRPRRRLGGAKEDDVAAGPREQGFQGVRACQAAIAQRARLRPLLSCERRRGSSGPDCAADHGAAGGCYWQQHRRQRVRVRACFPARGLPRRCLERCAVVAGRRGRLATGHRGDNLRVWPDRQR